MKPKTIKPMLLFGAAIILLLVSLSYNTLVENALIGIPTITDADSIIIGGQRVRLAGIDAPESNQTCKLKKTKEVFACGKQATEAFTKKIDGKSVRCLGEEKDIYDRLLAVCFINETNLNYWLVRNGWAIAYIKYSKEYLPAQTEAESENLGIWDSEFENPEDWRRSQRKR